MWIWGFWLDLPWSDRGQRNCTALTLHACFNVINIYFMTKHSIWDNVHYINSIAVFSPKNKRIYNLGWSTFRLPFNTFDIHSMHYSESFYPCNLWEIVSALKAFYPLCFPRYTQIVISVVWAMHYLLPIRHFVILLLGTKLRLRYDYCCQIKLKQGCIWNLKLKNNNFDHVT
jgi:hypothetical protein